MTNTAASARGKNTEEPMDIDDDRGPGTGCEQRPVIRGRKTRSMIEELRIVEPIVSFSPLYRVTGDWETLVESRQALEWIKGLCIGVLGGFMGLANGLIPESSSDLVKALGIYAFMVLMPLVLTALDALWAARHASDLELVDRAASGLDEWHADRRRQRSWRHVLVVATLLSALGAWMLWAMTQTDSWMNPWFFGPAALLLIGSSIRDVVRKWRKA